MTKHSLCPLIALFCFSASAIAQVDKASITGTLTDPSGATVAGAKITVSYPATALTRSVDTNASGAFLLVGLPVGHVIVDGAKPGFRPFRTEFDLAVGQTRTINFSMEISAVDTSVEVVSEADLDKSSAAVGAVFENEQISQLPINGRNWGGLMTLTPGAVAPEQGTARACASLARAATMSITGWTASTPRRFATRRKARAA